MTVSPTPDERSLTIDEVTLVRWLLEHGKSDASGFLSQLTDARVISGCPCGCASVDFAIAGMVSPDGCGMHILADYQWQGIDGSPFGVFVFSSGGLLAGLEVYSIDGQATATSLPTIEQLRPMVFSQGA